MNKPTVEYGVSFDGESQLRITIPQSDHVIICQSKSISEVKHRAIEALTQYFEETEEMCIRLVSEIMEMK